MAANETNVSLLLQLAQRCPTKDNLDAALAAVLAALQSAALQLIRRQSPGHSLSAEELIDEAFMRAIQREGAVVSRGVFRGYANKCMVHLRTDRARARRSRRAREDLFARENGLTAAADSGLFVTIDPLGEAPDARLDAASTYEAFQAALARIEAQSNDLACGVALFRECYESTTRWTLQPDDSLAPVPGKPLSVPEGGKRLGLSRATAFRRWKEFLEAFRKDLHEHHEAGLDTFLAGLEKVLSRGNNGDRR